MFWALRKNLLLSGFWPPKICGSACLLSPPLQVPSRYCSQVVDLTYLPSCAASKYLRWPLPFRPCREQFDSDELTPSRIVFFFVSFWGFWVRLWRKWMILRSVEMVLRVKCILHRSFARRVHPWLGGHLYLLFLYLKSGPRFVSVWNFGSWQWCRVFLNSFNLKQCLTR